MFKKTNNQFKPENKKNNNNLLLNQNQLKQLNKSLKRKKKDKILTVLTLSDLESGTLIPQIPFQIKTDKIKEVVILMAYLGLRVEEAINFDGTTAIVVKNSLKFKVVGKGNKERYVFNVFNNDYIRTKSLLLKANRIISLDYPVTRFGVRDHLHRLAKKLNGSGVPNPHDFRRAFASACLYERKMNKLALQQLLGHSFFSTTEIYLRKDPRTLESMLEEFL